MNDLSQMTAEDIGFFRNTGLALVFLTPMAGSISLIGSLAFLPGQTVANSSYGNEPDAYAELNSPAE